MKKHAESLYDRRTNNVRQSYELVRVVWQSRDFFANLYGCSTNFKAVVRIRTAALWMFSTRIYDFVAYEHRTAAVRSLQIVLMYVW